MNAYPRCAALLIVLGLMAAGVAGPAYAITFTPAGTTYSAVLVSGTNVVFTDNFTGLTVHCNNFFTMATTSNPASASVQLTAGSTNLLIDTGTPSFTCPYSGFGTGQAAITTTATWTWTVTSLTAGVASGSFTLPASAASMKLTGLLNCTVTWQASTIGVLYNNSLQQLISQGGNSLKTSGCLTTPSPTLTWAQQLKPSTIKVT